MLKCDFDRWLAVHTGQWFELRVPSRQLRKVIRPKNHGLARGSMYIHLLFPHYPKTKTLLFLHVPRFRTAPVSCHKVLARYLVLLCCLLKWAANTRHGAGSRVVLCMRSDVEFRVCVLRHAQRCSRDHISLFPAPWPLLGNRDTGKGGHIHHRNRCLL